MYRIIASEGLQGAILEKDGQLYSSIGPERIFHLYEEDLMPISKISLGERLKEGAILHTPPPKLKNSKTGPTRSSHTKQRTNQRLLMQRTDPSTIRA